MKGDPEHAVGGSVLHAKGRPGQQVRIGQKGEILATIEEVIWSRGMTSPFYLVEWWHEGQLVTRRLHEADLKDATDAPVTTRISFIRNQGEAL